jgi:hypothetical protein
MRDRVSPPFDPEHDAAQELDALIRRNVGPDPKSGIGCALKETLQSGPSLPGVHVVSPARDAVDQRFGHEGIVRDARRLLRPMRLQKQDRCTQRVSKLAERIACRGHQ